MGLPGALHAQVEGGPSWDQNEGTELYDISGDGPAAPVNLFDDDAYAGIVKHLSNLLHNGPTTGGGWGPSSS